MRANLEVEGKEITLLGTAHVSKESVEEVRESIESIKPDFVGVELDEARFDSLSNKQGWKELDIAEALRQGKGYLLLFNLLLSIYQRQLGVELGVEPGTEMMEAVNTAKSIGADYGLVDRDLNETFERLREELTFFEKIKIIYALAFGFFEEGDDIEELKTENVLSTLIKDLEKGFPSIKRVLLDERNAYMAEKILSQDFEKGVIVVGAAHVEGLEKELKQRSDFEQTKDSHIPWFKILRYAIPATILAGLGYSFYKIGFSTGVKASVFWVGINGILAALGAIIARSHFATWIVSFIAAPITSLDPALGAGMVAAYFEGKVYPPTVGEMEEIAYLEDYRSLWGNQAGRIILTFFLVSLGSALATFIGAGYIASLLA